MERSWSNYKANQDRINRIGKRRSRPENEMDVKVILIMAVIILGSIAFLVFKHYF
jgi:hypothetical protein